MVPQFAPAGQAVIGVQPQWLGVPGAPPPHVCGMVQLPQLTERVSPQLSEAVTDPQFALPCAVQKAGSPWYVQPQWLAPAPPPPQVSPVPVQVPQLATVRMAPQLSAAVSEPH
jgi:hypothetical protein